MNKFSWAAAMGVLLTSSSIAFAHVSLAPGNAKIGSAYKAIFQVPHGCAGAATTAIRVRIPEGVIDVKPQPKAGWKLDIVRGAYAGPHNLWGAKVTEGVKEVVWSGGELLDSEYEEFMLHSVVAADLKPGELYFPVVQECGTATTRWIDIPAPGKSEDDYETPAPSVHLVPKG